MGRTVRGARVTLVATLALIAAVAACSMPGTPTANTDYSHATITASHTVKTKGLTAGGAAVASPNGRLVVFSRGGRPCLLTVADGSTTCAPADTPVTADASTAQWAPDSSAVAFTDDFRRYLHEPDIWLMDAEDGSARDLTDDGESDITFSGTLAAPIDLNPTWTDPSTIVFARQQGRKEASADLMSVPASGGKAHTLGRLDTSVLYLNAMVASPDGSLLAYSVSDDRYRTAEVHLRSLPDGTDTVVLQADHDASLLSFSADGRYLLVTSIAPGVTYEPDRTSDATVVTVADHTAAPVAADGSAWSPAWSPTGHALVFLSITASDKTNKTALHVLAEPGATARRITGGAGAVIVGQQVRWTPSGIILRTRDGVRALTVTTS